MAESEDKVGAQEQSIKSLTERLAVLRTELNGLKSIQVNSQRTLDEVNTRHQQEMAQTSGRLQSLAEERHREVAQLNGLIQGYVST